MTSQTFPEGSVPLINDTERTMLIKILNVLNNLTSSGGGAIPPGTVDPNGNIIGNPGQRYFNTTGSTDWLKLTGVGNTGWIQLQ